MDAHKRARQRDPASAGRVLRQAMWAAWARGSRGEPLGLPEPVLRGYHFRDPRGPLHLFSKGAESTLDYYYGKTWAARIQKAHRRGAAGEPWGDRTEVAQGVWIEADYDDADYDDVEWEDL